MKLARIHAASIVLLLMCTTTSLAQAPSQGTATTPQSSSQTPDVIFVATKEVVVDAMLRLANVTKSDVVYDLGCGDGRIVITAAKEYGARGVGIDIDPKRIAESRANAVGAGVTELVKFRQEDLFKSDFSEATVVTLYLLSTLNERLRPRLLQQLNPGTRIVSHDFAMGDWKPDKTITVKADDRQHTVFLWTVPVRSAAR